MIFMDQDYRNLDFYFMFMNCDNNLENPKIGEEKWKVRPMEDEFNKVIDVTIKIEEK